MAFDLNIPLLWKILRISGNLAGGWGRGGGIAGWSLEHEEPDGGPGSPWEMATDLWMVRVGRNFILFWSNPQMRN